MIEIFKWNPEQLKQKRNEGKLISQGPNDFRRGSIDRMTDTDDMRKTSGDNTSLQMDLHLRPGAEGPAAHCFSEGV